MSIELQDTLSICRQIRNNDRDSGTHYLLGYLWANTPDKEKERILAISLMASKIPTKNPELISMSRGWCFRKHQRLRNLS